jgi:hypothetical protein
MKTHSTIAVAIAASAATMIAAPNAAGAERPQHWGLCAAADTIPLCEIVPRDDPPGSDGTIVTRRPDEAVDEADSPVAPPCLDPDRSPTAGDVAACTHTGKPSDPVPDVRTDCGHRSWPEVVGCPD